MGSLCLYSQGIQVVKEKSLYLVYIIKKGLGILNVQKH
jgi:hypothetical protein